MSPDPWLDYGGPLCDDPAERHRWGQEVPAGDGPDAYDVDGWRFAAFGPFQPASDGPDSADLAQRRWPS